MDEFGPNGTWKILLIIGPNPKLSNPVVLWKNELLIEDVDGMACCFNLAMQEIKNLPGQRGLKYSSVVTYVNSLVSVKRRKEA